MVEGYPCKLLRGTIKPKTTAPSVPVSMVREPVFRATSARDGRFGIVREINNRQPEIIIEILPPILPQTRERPWAPREYSGRE